MTVAIFICCLVPFIVSYLYWYFVIQATEIKARSQKVLFTVTGKRCEERISNGDEIVTANITACGDIDGVRYNREFFTTLSWHKMTIIAVWPFYYDPCNVAESLCAADSL